jgi:hypothetical protein
MSPLGLRSKSQFSGCGISLLYAIKLWVKPKGKQSSKQPENGRFTMKNPMSAAESRFILFCGILSASALSGCDKGLLDSSVDALVTNMVVGDFEKFKDLARPELMDVLDKAKYQEISAGVKELGSFKERTMTKIETKNNERNGEYKLTFDKGDVNLSIKLHEGKLIAFEFSGPVMDKAMHQAGLEKYKEFKIDLFQFIDEGGKPKNNIYKQGNKISFHFNANGLTPKDNKLSLSVTLKILNGGGTEIYSDPNFYKDNLDYDNEKSLPYVAINGHINAAEAGNYKLVLQVVDMPTQRATEFSEAFVVE